MGTGYTKNEARQILGTLRKDVKPPYRLLGYQRLGTVELVPVIGADTAAPFDSFAALYRYFRQFVPFGRFIVVVEGRETEGGGEGAVGILDTNILKKALA